MTVEDKEPVVDGNQGDIKDEDVQLVRTWIKANKSEIKKVWDDEVQIFDARWVNPFDAKWGCSHGTHSPMWAS